MTKTIEQIDAEMAQQHDCLENRFNAAWDKAELKMDAEAKAITAKNDHIAKLSKDLANIPTEIKTIEYFKDVAVSMVKANELDQAETTINEMKAYRAWLMIRRGEGVTTAPSLIELFGAFKSKKPVIKQAFSIN